MALEICNDGSGKPLQFEVRGKNGAGYIVTAMFGTRVKGDVLVGENAWHIGAEALDEHGPVDWPVRLFPSYGGYCGRLEVDVPESVTVTAL